jgi:alcohol dehydrogenase
MTATASALVLTEPRSLVGVELPLPRLGADDALLRVEACGLCGTDHEGFTGMWRARRPYVPGHETVGVIEAIGDGAAERLAVGVGQRVALEPFQSCRSCHACGAGDYRHCERHGITDAYGFTAVEQPPGLWGGYAQYQYLSPDSLLLPVPDVLDPVMATLFNPVGAGIRWTVQLPHLAPGSVVAVLGPGVRGLAACAAAKSAGAAFVMVTGAPMDADRLALAPSFGADLAVDAISSDPVRALRDAVGRLADVVVDVTAGAPAAFTQAIELAAHGGTIVVAGIRGKPDPPNFWPDHIVTKELHIIGTIGVDVDAYRPALELLAEGRYPFAELPRRCVGLDGAAELLGAMAGESSDFRPVHGVIVP